MRLERLIIVVLSCALGVGVVEVAPGESAALVAARERPAAATMATEKPGGLSAMPGGDRGAGNLRANRRGAVQDAEKHARVFVMVGVGSPAGLVQLGSGRM